MDPTLFRLLMLEEGRRRVDYRDKVLGTQPADLILYHMMAEASGTTANDESDENNDGAYTGVTLGETGIGDGRTAPLFDGTNDFNDIYSAALNTDWDGAEHTIAVWMRVLNSGIWTDGTFDVGPRLEADANNLSQIYKNSDNDKITWNSAGGGTSSSRDSAAFSSTGWFHVAITRSESADEVRAYLDGVQVGATMTSIGTWSGALLSTATLFGGSDNTPSLPWNGYGAHLALWKSALLPSQVAGIAAV